MMRSIVDVQPQFGKLIMTFMNVTSYDCFQYKLPKEWLTEESEDRLLLYDPKGNGAMVLSFLNAIDNQKALEEQIGVLSKRFVDQNRITLSRPFVMYGSEETKFAMLYNNGPISKLY